MFGAGEDEQKKVPRGRLARLAQVGKLATGLAGELAGAAGRLALGSGRTETAAAFHRKAAARLVRVLGQMKGLPMKAGQMLSYVDDVIPAAYREHYREALRALQVKARPMRWREIEQVLRADLGASPDEVFARFDRTPVASASIGQVYRAALQDGTEVAVKVQYPGIADAIRSDLKNVELLRDALSLVLPRLDVDRTLADISSRVLEECDYGCELCNQDDFQRAWAGDPGVFVPRVFPALSGDHVLVTEHVTGRAFEDMLAHTTQAERDRLAGTLYRFVFRSLYVFQMFNGDPHPGNYLFPADGRVAFLDFGCVQRFDRSAVTGFARARRLATGGVRGPELWDALRAAYGLETLDEEEWRFAEEYLLALFAPVMAPQPFRFDRAYTERLADLGLKGAFLEARKAVRKGVTEAKVPGLVFLNRLTYGFVSILAAMQAQADWRAVMEAIDAEAGSAT